MILDEDEEDIAIEYVRMVGTETYDLTYSDNDEDWIMFKDPSESQGEAPDEGREQSELCPKCCWRRRYDGDPRLRR